MADAALTRDEVLAMKVEELKQALRARGLAVSGRKAELQNRLLAAQAEEGDADVVEDYGDDHDDLHDDELDDILERAERPRARRDAEEEEEVAAEEEETLRSAADLDEDHDEDTAAALEPTTAEQGSAVRDVPTLSKPRGIRMDVGMTETELMLARQERAKKFGIDALPAKAQIELRRRRFAAAQGDADASEQSKKGDFSIHSVVGDTEEAQGLTADMLRRRREKFGGEAISLALAESQLHNRRSKRGGGQGADGTAKAQRRLRFGGTDSHNGGSRSGAPQISMDMSLDEFAALDRQQRRQDRQGRRGRRGGRRGGGRGRGRGRGGRVPRSDGRSRSRERRPRRAVDPFANQDVDYFGAIEDDAVSRRKQRFRT